MKLAVDILIRFYLNLISIYSYVGSTLSTKVKGGLTLNQPLPILVSGFLITSRMKNKFNTRARECARKDLIPSSKVLGSQVTGYH